MVEEERGGSNIAIFLGAFCEKSVCRAFSEFRAVHAGEMWAGPQPDAVRTEEGEQVGGIAAMNELKWNLFCNFLNLNQIEYQTNSVKLRTSHD